MADPPLAESFEGAKDSLPSRRHEAVMAVPFVAPADVSGTNSDIIQPFFAEATKGILRWCEEWWT